MPRIENANLLKLNALVEQLTADGTPDTQEVRSKGNDLYTKERKATPTASSSPGERQSEAVKLVCSCLAEEFNTTADNAQQILTHVFGQAPTRMTVSDLKRLRDLGEAAAPLIAAGLDAVEAFGSAQAPKEAPKSAPSPPAPLSTTAVSAPEIEATTADHASADISKWQNDRQPSPESVIAYSVANGTITSEQGASKLADLSKMKNYFTTMVNHVANGTLTPEQVASQVPAAETHHFFKAMTALIASGLPSCFQSTPKQQRVWFNIALTLGNPGFLQRNLIESLLTEHKISLQWVLASALRSLRKRAAAVPEQAVIARAIITLNCAYTWDELMRDSEIEKLEAVLFEVSSNPILRNAYADWERMDKSSRHEAIQNLIDLHAEQYAYVSNKPKLVFEHNADRTIGGAAGHGSIIINTNSRKFDNFRLVFTDVIHETTHWYQATLISMYNHMNTDTDAAETNLTAILVASRLSGIDRTYLMQTLGFSATEAFEGYKSMPDELHAFSMGDYALASIEDLFAPEEQTGEQQ